MLVRKEKRSKLGSQGAARAPRAFASSKSDEVGGDAVVSGEARSVLTLELSDSAGGLLGRAARDGNDSDGNDSDGNDEAATSPLPSSPNTGNNGAEGDASITRKATSNTQARLPSSNAQRACSARISTTQASADRLAAL
jgi:hypothetical protein